MAVFIINTSNGPITLPPAYGSAILPQKGGIVIADTLANVQTTLAYTLAPNVFKLSTVSDGQTGAVTPIVVGTVAAGTVTSTQLAAGASATNVGALGGVLGGTLPNPTMAAGAASTNVGALGGVLGGTLPNPTLLAPQHAATGTSGTPEQLTAAQSGSTVSDNATAIARFLSAPANRAR